MRLSNYINEAKWLENPMIGFGIDPSAIKDVIKYIKDELLLENIKYQEINDNHLTISQILGKYDKADLVRATHSIDTKLTLHPVKIDILRGKRVPKDFIVIIYKPHSKFVQDVKGLSDEFKTMKFPDITPHISLFMVKRGAISDELMKSLSDGAPKLKAIKPTEVQLWNLKHEKEYIK